ncbi:MAG: hypothetical protein IT275_07760 [Chitinophagales bacterium]|nr:hypothetical protein [Chitinophagales bacterium]
MKKITTTANATINTIVACVAKAKTFQTSKVFLFVCIATAMLFFSSCARNSTGCGNGTWACKNSNKYKMDKKGAKYMANIYKCPSNQQYSR